MSSSLLLQQYPACLVCLTFIVFVMGGKWPLCSPMAWETWVQSYQRLRKWYLIPPCLTLSITRYGSKVKWVNPGKRVAPSPTPWYCSNRKGSLRVTLDYSHQLYFYWSINAQKVTLFLERKSYFPYIICNLHINSPSQLTIDFQSDSNQDLMVTIPLSSFYKSFLLKRNLWISLYTREGTFLCINIHFTLELRDWDLYYAKKVLPIK